MTAPATKQDVADLATATKQDIADLATATKRDIKNLAVDFQSAVAEIKRYFDVANEQFKKDLASIDTDKMKDHEQRLIHLEVIVGVRR